MNSHSTIHFHSISRSDTASSNLLPPSQTYLHYTSVSIRSDTEHRDLKYFLIRLKRWDPMYSDSPCAKQPTPFNLNRYFFLISYTISIILSGSIYFGWPGLSSLLFESGAYSWLCPEGSFIPDKRYLCEAQDSAVQRLYQIAMPSHFMMSMVAGFLIDNVGPKFTSILGLSLNLTAWTLLTFASHDFNVYILAFVLIGLGADTGFLPTLHASNLFPGYNGTVTAIFGAANSASFSVPMVMHSISETYGVSFKTICYSYACILAGLIINAALFIPKKCFKPTAYYTALSDIALTSSSDKYDEIYLSNKDQNLFMKFFLNLRDAIVHFKSRQFAAIAFFFCTTSLILNFYTVSGEQLLTTRVNNFFGAVIPFGFIFTIIYGKISDIWGPITVMFLNTSCGLLSYSFANLPIGFKYISTICMMAYSSIYTSQVYFYVQKKFDNNHFGKLVGTVSMFGGVIMFLSVYLYDPVTKVYLNGNFLYVTFIMIALLLLNYCSLHFMRGKPKESIKKLHKKALSKTNSIEI